MRQHSERPTEEETIPNCTVSLSPRFGMVLPLACPDQPTHMSLFASPFGFPHLPDLQEMSIWVMEEGPGLVAPLERRSEKLGSARAQDLVGGQAVRNLNAQFADDALAVGRRIGRGRIVWSGTKRRRQENLAPCSLDVCPQQCAEGLSCRIWDSFPVSFGRRRRARLPIGRR